MVKFSDELKRWLKLQKNNDIHKQEFYDLTHYLTEAIFAVRFTGVATGEIKDREQELENIGLKTKVKTLESENKQAVEQLSKVKIELDELQGTKSVDKEFHGFK